MKDVASLLRTKAPEIPPGNKEEVIEIRMESVNWSHDTPALLTDVSNEWSKEGSDIGRKWSNDKSGD